MAINGINNKQSNGGNNSVASSPSSSVPTASSPLTAASPPVQSSLGTSVKKHILKKQLMPPSLSDAIKDQRRSKLAMKRAQQQQAAGTSTFANGALLANKLQQGSAFGNNTQPQSAFAQLCQVQAAVSQTAITHYYCYNTPIPTAGTC